MMKINVSEHPITAVAMDKDEDVIYAGDQLGKVFMVGITGKVLATQTVALKVLGPVTMILALDKIFAYTALGNTAFATTNLNVLYTRDSTAKYSTDETGKILGKTSKKNCIKSEIGIIYLTPLPPYLKSEKQKNEILVCLRPPLPPAKSEKFGHF